MLCWLKEASHLRPNKGFFCFVDRSTLCLCNILPRRDLPAKVNAVISFSGNFFALSTATQSLRKRTRYPVISNIALEIEELSMIQ
mmetsp:Transcript_5513/g.12031  ORF Transcript_5513/g.12031 Transcript_5513/m.12031 type:complete len:85 (-) Transcript_5513:15-269(-)